MAKQVKRGTKFHVRKGDTVIVIAGNDKGKKGKVLDRITSYNVCYTKLLREVPFYPDTQVQFYSVFSWKLPGNTMEALRFPWHF